MGHAGEIGAQLLGMLESVHRGYSQLKAGADGDNLVFRLTSSVDHSGKEDNKAEEYIEKTRPRREIPVRTRLHETKSDFPTLVEKIIMADGFKKQWAVLSRELEAVQTTQQQG